MWIVATCLKSVVHLESLVGRCNRLRREHQSVDQEEHLLVAQKLLDHLFLVAFCELRKRDFVVIEMIELRPLRHSRQAESIRRLALVVLAKVCLLTLRRGFYHFDSRLDVALDDFFFGLHVDGGSSGWKDNTLTSLMAFSKMTLKG